MTSQQLNKLKASAKKLIIKIKNNVTVDKPVSSDSSTSSCNATCVSVSFDGIESAHCLDHSVTDAVKFSKEGKNGSLKGGDLDEGEEEEEASDKDDTMAKDVEDVEDVVAPPSPSDSISSNELTSHWQKTTPARFTARRAQL